MTMQKKSDGSPVRLMWIGDLITPSGFGRIGNHVTRKLSERGWHIIGASLLWHGHPWNTLLPFPIIPLGGKDMPTMWASIGSVIQAENPDVVIVCQDFPYAVTAFHSLGVDWSQKKFICITPIDGTPVHPQWLELAGLVDATMVISKFGVEAMRLSGRQVDLLHPGVDVNEFYPAIDREEVNALRRRMAIPDNAFVTGSFMMNQGRKMVSATIAQFIKFATDKPDAWLYLDMDKASPAGWDVPSLLQQIKADPAIVGRIIYKEDAFRAGITGLRERYILCDVSCQMAHREGFGLPNLESMACKVPPMVIDWCSGSEIAGNGRGILVRRIDYMEHGTWGGAQDAFPDTKDWLMKWNAVYRDRDMLSSIAIKGHAWAKRQTWDKATTQAETVLRRVLNEQNVKDRSHVKPGIISPTPAPSDTSDGRGNTIPALAAIPPAPAALDNQHPDPGIQRPADGDKKSESSAADG